MSNNKPLAKGASSQPQPADSAASATTESVATVEAPESAAPAALDSARPSLADLKRAAYEGREFEVSKAVSWAPDYVPGTGFYADGARRYSATAAHNAGEAALDALASDSNYVVRLV